MLLSLKNPQDQVPLSPQERDRNYALYKAWVPEHFPKYHTVNHEDKEYVRYEKELTVTTNTVESLFAFLKRSNHRMSRKYLGSYRAERDLVYNGRKLSDDE